MRRRVVAAAFALAVSAGIASTGLAQGRLGAPHLDLPVTVSSGPVTVRAQAGLRGDAERLAHDIPDRLHAIAADLAELPTPSSVELRLVKQSENLPAVAPRGRGAPPWAVGVAYRGTNVVTAALRRRSQPTDLDATVTHELAHLALDTAMGDHPIPRWLNEGFAYLHSSDFSFERARTLTGMAWTGDVIPLAQLDDSFPAGEMAASRAYAQSYDFVAFLARRGRFADQDDDGNRWPFRDFIAELAHGSTLDEAARSAYAASMEQLFREWTQSLRSRYMFSPIGLFGVLIWVIGGLLLILAYLRKRRLARAIVSAWDEQDDVSSTDPGSSTLQSQHSRPVAAPEARRAENRSAVYRGK